MAFKDLLDNVRQDGIDPIRQGIPFEMFVAEWENTYGLTFYEGFYEEMEREYVKGGFIDIGAAQDYWRSLHSWWLDNNVFNEE